MRFIPGPASVLEAPLNIGFVRRNEQTGHPAQKPLSVIEPLLLMSTKERDTVSRSHVRIRNHRGGMLASQSVCGPVRQF